MAPQVAVEPTTLRLTVPSLVEGNCSIVKRRDDCDVVFSIHLQVGNRLQKSPTALHFKPLSLYCCIPVGMNRVAGAT
jgi:hypothetical protein